MADGWHPKFLDYLSQEYQRMMDYYHKDPSFKEAVHAAVGDDHPTPQSVIAAQATQNANQIAQTNPPPKQPWDDWDDKKRAQADAALEQLNGILTYRNARNSGVITPDLQQFAQASADLQRNGGLTPEQALQASRYAAYKRNEPDILTGPREPILTPEQRDLQGRQFMASSRLGKERMEAENHPKEYRQLYESHFDSLSGPGTPAVSQPLPASQPIAQEPGQEIKLAPQQQESPR